MAAAFGLAAAATRGPGPWLPHAETSTTEHAAAARPHTARRLALGRGPHAARDACRGPPCSARGIPGRVPEVITVFPLLPPLPTVPRSEDHSLRCRRSRNKGEPSQLGAFPLFLVSPLGHPFGHDAASAAHDLRGTSLTPQPRTRRKHTPTCRADSPETARRTTARRASSSHCMVHSLSGTSGRSSRGAA